MSDKNKTDDKCGYARCVRCPESENLAEYLAARPGFHNRLIGLAGVLLCAELVAIIYVWWWAGF